MPITIDLDDSAVADLLSGPCGAVVSHIGEVTNAVRNEAVRRCPRDEGHLAASLEATVTAEPGRVVGRVGTNLDYAMYVHEGTGLYGPRGQVIRPVSAKVLVFRPSRGAGGVRLANTMAVSQRGPMVFAAFVRGQKPQPFLREALEA